MVKEFLMLQTVHNFNHEHVADDESKWVDWKCWTWKWRTNLQEMKLQDIHDHLILVLQIDKRVDRQHNVTISHFSLHAQSCKNDVWPNEHLDRCI